MTWLRPYHPCSNALTLCYKIDPDTDRFFDRYQISLRGMEVPFLDSLGGCCCQCCITFEYFKAINPAVGSDRALKPYHTFDFVLFGLWRIFGSVVVGRLLN